MAASFTTTDSSGLLRAFKAAIDNGSIKTWRYDNHGDFYHTDHQFQGKAWFRPSTQSTSLTFNILKPQGASVSYFVYAYYHGHIIETFIFHFNQSFSLAAATPTGTSNDVL
jgi:hypothetical protein